MSSAIDYQNLSKNELIAMLINSEEKAASYKNRAIKAEERVHNIVNLLKERKDFMKEIFNEAKKLYGLIDKVTYDNLEPQLIEILNEYTQWIINAKAWRDELYKKGNDISRSNKNEKENGNNDGDKSNKKKNGSNNGASDRSDGAPTDKASDSSDELKDIIPDVEPTIKNGNKFDKAVTFLRKAAKLLAQEDINICGEDITSILSVEPNEKDEKNKRSPGRQSVDRGKPRLAEAKDDGFCCPKCNRELMHVATLDQKVIALIRKLEKDHEFLQLNSDISVCEQCGYTHVSIPENEDLPIQPDRGISLRTMLLCCSGVAQGIPLNRFAKYMQEVFHLGHSTAQENFHVFVRNYLAPIEGFIYERAKRSENLIADGTPFDVLECQNLGNCMHSNPERKRPLNRPKPNPVEKGKSNYLLCLCSVPGAKEQFVYFSFLPTRSYKAIANVITKDFHPKTIICDAFKPYDKIAKELGCSIQNCIIHFRRKLIEACVPEKIIDNVLQMDEPHQLEYFRDQLQKDDSSIVLFSVLSGLATLFSYENSFDRSQPGFREEILEVRQTKERTIMDAMDSIMGQLVEKYTDPVKGGTTRQARRGESASVPAIYWYNNHDKFRIFLNDPMVPPDSNKVERCIRPATIVRKNSYFMTSQQGVEDLCTILTVFETLKQEGIQNPAAALEDYCRALYSHCLDAGYTKARLEGDYSGKKIVSWNMADLSKNFDFSKYIPKIFKK